MKWNFLYQITAASRTPNKVATAPRSRSLCPQLNLLNPPPPPNKITGYPTAFINPFFLFVCFIFNIIFTADEND